MVREIVYYIGGFSSYHSVTKLLSENKNRLQAQGVLYPDRLEPEQDRSPFPDQSLLFWLCVDEQDQLLCEYHLRRLREQVCAAPGPVETLCLCVPHFPYSQPTRLALPHALCRKVFPNARQRVVFSLARQDREIAYYNNYYLLRGMRGSDVHPLVMLRRMHKSLFEYSGILATLFDIFGQGNVACPIVGDGSPDVSEAGPPDGASVLGVLCGGHTALAEELAADAAPCSLLHLPRELVYFIWRINYWRENFLPGSRREDTDWFSQASRLAAFAACPPSSPSLFGPDLRATLAARFARDNAATMQLLKLRSLFREPEAEPAWCPFEGVTPETALFIARLLDRDFAATLLDGLRFVPEQYVSYDMNVIRQALADATQTPVSVKPRRLPPQPVVSVLTPTFNHADFIEDCIKGVIAQQTEYSIQHVIADDGSTDGTQDIILEYAARYPHIVPILQPKRTYGSNNTRDLFALARSEFVALCDGDDYFTDPGKLHVQIDFLKRHPDCSLCFHPVQVLYEDQPEKQRVFPPAEELPGGVRPFYTLRDLIRFNFIQTNSVVYRWRYRHGLPDSFRTDLVPADWFWHLFHAELGAIGFINTVMSVYRRHRSSLYTQGETDPLTHRYTNGFLELRTYNAINEHFKGRFANDLCTLADGVIADMLQYMVDNEIPSEKMLTDLADEYPAFASHFLDSLRTL